MVWAPVMKTRNLACRWGSVSLALALASGCGDDEPAEQSSDSDATGSTSSDSTGGEGEKEDEDGTSDPATSGEPGTTGEASETGVDDETGAGETTADGGSGTGAETTGEGGSSSGSTGGDGVQECQADVAGTLRVATYNGSLSFFGEGPTGLIDALMGDGRNAPQVAEVIQTVCPDVLLLNEFDYDAQGQAADAFREGYLEVAQREGGEIAVYPHVFVAPSNTGVMPDTPQDFDNNGEPGQGGNDAFGFGNHPGEFAFAVFSKYPIVTEDIRCFQAFLWRDMPGALLPVDPETGEPWFTDEELALFRLSSKNHCDIPIRVGDDVLHVLASHPTPPVFDGPEDRNGRRNHDEIRFWADYVSTNPDDAAYIVDDDGIAGGAVADEPFVIMGDLNSDPFDGDSVPGVMESLLQAERVNARLTPLSQGGVEASILDGLVNATHGGNPAFDTGDFSEPPGNLRIDYVLPSSTVTSSGVFWPPRSNPQGQVAAEASDHRMVWADLDFEVPPPAPIRFTEVPLDGRPETIRFEETNLGNLVADAMLWEGQRSHEAAGAPRPVLALQNGGGIRNGDIIPVGEIVDPRFDDILRFDNQVVVVQDVLPVDLVGILERGVRDIPGDDFNGPFPQVAGMQWTWDPSAAPGERITELTVLADPPVVVVEDGVVDEDAGPFDLVTNSFVAGGGDDWPLGSYDSIEVADDQRQTLRDFVDSFPGRTVPAERYPEGGDGRITRLDPE